MLPRFASLLRHAAAADALASRRAAAAALGAPAGAAPPRAPPARARRLERACVRVPHRLGLRQRLLEGRVRLVPRARDAPRAKGPRHAARELRAQKRQRRAARLEEQLPALRTQVLTEFISVVRSPIAIDSSGGRAAGVQPPPAAAGGAGAAAAASTTWGRSSSRDPASGSGHGRREPANGAADEPAADALRSVGGGAMGNAEAAATQPRRGPGQSQPRELARRASRSSC